MEPLALQGVPHFCKTRKLLLRNEVLTFKGLTLWVSDRRVIFHAGGKDWERLIPGKWRTSSEGVRPLAPGDILELTGSEVDPQIKERAARRNEFTRRSAGPKPTPQTIACNLDMVIVTASAAKPEMPFGLVDRLLATALLGGAPCSLLINKIDLISPSQLARWSENYQRAFDSIVFTSAVTGEGMESLARLLHNRVTLLVGASGVGKSSLLNSIEPGLKLKVGEISNATGKGRHITTSARLYPLARGGWTADTPGLRECAPWGLNTNNLIQAFPELAAIEGGCRFRNCRHQGEEGCAVSSEEPSRYISPQRYQSYLKLLAGLTTNARE